MLKLAVFADDLTGALDTAVQFSSAGVKTRVAVGTELPADCTAGVCDLETRHLSPDEAARITAAAIDSARRNGAEYIYIKTDSGLRGNIGAELEAALAAEDGILFAPSYPENGRITRGGVHLIDGIAVSRSLFGTDARNPVRHDRVSDILRETGNITACELPAGVRPGRTGVYIADAATDDELRTAAENALSAGIHCFAGCAGLAKQLVGLLPLPLRERSREPEKRPLLTLCGSISPVALAQLRAAKVSGINCARLKDIREDEIVQALDNKGSMIVASAFDEDDIGKNNADGETAESIAERFGGLAARIVQRTDCGLFIIGGDTLLSVIGALGNCSAEPLREFGSATVVCSLRRDEREGLLITKSGSFGTQDAVSRTIKEFSAR